MCFNFVNPFSLCAVLSDHWGQRGAVWAGGHPEGAGGAAAPEGGAGETGEELQTHWWYWADGRSRYWALKQPFKRKDSAQCIYHVALKKHVWTAHIFKSGQLALCPTFYKTETPCGGIYMLPPPQLTQEDVSPEKTVKTGRQKSERPTGPVVAGKSHRLARTRLGLGHASVHIWVSVRSVTVFSVSLSCGSGQSGSHASCHPVSVL